MVISINDPRERSDELVRELKERFALADARVVTTPRGGNLIEGLRCVLDERNLVTLCALFLRASTASRRKPTAAS